jgi:hypothetical protein
MPNTITQPAVGGIVVRAPGPSHVRQAAAHLAPLAQVAGQDSTPYSSAWVQVPPGSFLQVHLHITNKVGNLVVHVETCTRCEVVGGVHVNVDPPRVVGVFAQVSGTILPASPSVEPLRGVPLADNYIRVVATPGQGAGQTCDWAVTGQAIAAAYARTA